MCLTNAAMGGLTEGYLGQERARQVEVANALRAEESKKRRRTKLTNWRAVLGKDLLVKLKQLTLQESPKTPQQTQARIRSKWKLLLPKPSESRTSQTQYIYHLHLQMSLIARAVP